MVKLLVIIDGKGGSALLLEWAEADKFAATALQLHLATDHIRGRHTVFNLIKKARRKRHEPSLRLYRKSRH